MSPATISPVTEYAHISGVRGIVCYNEDEEYPPLRKRPTEFYRWRCFVYSILYSYHVPRKLFVNLNSASPACLPVRVEICKVISRVVASAPPPRLYTDELDTPVLVFAL